VKMNKFDRFNMIVNTLPSYGLQPVGLEGSVRLGHGYAIPTPYVLREKR